MRSYVLGSGGAILFGVLACYAAIWIQGGTTLKGWDFFYYYSASHMVVTGMGARIYDLHALGRVETALARPYHVPNGVIPVPAPPFFVLLLAPLAALPYNLAYFVWLAFNAFLLAVPLFLLERIAGLPRRGALLFRVAVLLSLPCLAALLQGQQSVWLLWAMTGVGFALFANRPYVAGIMLSLVLVKPQYVLAFGLLLVLRRQWRALAAFVIAAAVLTAAPVPVLGVQINASYARLLLNATNWGSNVGGFGPTVNRGLAGALQLLLPRPESTAVTLVLTVVILLILAERALRVPSLDVPFGLAVIVTILISPHLLIHDLLLLAIPAAISLARRRDGVSGLKAVLVFVYLAIPAGFALSLVAPVQLSVFAMIALGWWLLAASAAQAHRDVQVAAAPSVASLP